MRTAIFDLQKTHDDGDEEAGDSYRHVKLLDDLLSAEFFEVEEAMDDMKKNGVTLCHYVDHLPAQTRHFRPSGLPGLSLAPPVLGIWS